MELIAYRRRDRSRERDDRHGDDRRDRRRDERMPRDYDERSAPPMQPMY